MAAYMGAVALSGFYYSIVNPADIVCWNDTKISVFYKRRSRTKAHRCMSWESDSLG